MIPTSDLDRDQTEQDAPLDPRLITDLQTAYRRPPSLDAVDDAVRRAVDARVAQQSARERRGRSRRLLPRLSGPAAALVILALGLGAYLHGQSPTPVSAQTVLHRAAAAGPGPNEASHATYRVSSSDGRTGTADVWIGYGGSGTATQLALNLSMSRSGSSGASLNASVAAAGPQLLELYDPAAKSPAVLQIPAPPAQGASSGSISAAKYLPGQALKSIVVGTLLAQKLSKQPDAYKLEQETLDGVPVYALQVTGADSAGGRTTFYFNAQTYVLEGADWVQGSVSWQARLEPGSYHTMPRPAVPAGTFPATSGGETTSSAGSHSGIGGGMGLSTGGPASSNGQVVEGATPGGVRIGLAAGGPNGAAAHVTISASVPALKGAAVDLTQALATACHTTPQALATAMQPAARSILAICQQTNANISADQLVTALLVPVQSALDGLVRSGTITASQESSDLTNLRAQLAHLVTSAADIHTSGTGPTKQQP